MNSENSTDLMPLRAAGIDLTDTQARIIRANERQIVVAFPNNYGASIVCDAFSYGGSEGLYEMAVLVIDHGDEFSLTYETPVTDDVLGYLDPAQTAAYLHEIAALPLREREF